MLMIGVLTLNVDITAVGDPPESRSGNRANYKRLITGKDTGIPLRTRRFRLSILILD